jgi:hypothetical protein
MPEECRMNLGPLPCLGLGGLSAAALGIVRPLCLALFEGQRLETVAPAKKPTRGPPKSTRESP